MDNRIIPYENAEFGSADVEIIDTNGTEEYQALKEVQVETSNGFIIIAAVDSQQSLEEACKHYQVVKSKAPPEAPVVIAINKSDIDQSRCIAQVKEISKAIDNIFPNESKNTEKLMMCDLSCKLNNNVKKSFEFCMSRMFLVKSLASTKKKKRGMFSSIFKPKSTK